MVEIGTYVGLVVLAYLAGMVLLFSQAVIMSKLADAFAWVGARLRLSESVSAFLLMVLVAIIVPFALIILGALLTGSTRP